MEPVSENVHDEAAMTTKEQTHSGASMKRVKW